MVFNRNTVMAIAVIPLMLIAGLTATPAYASACKIQYKIHKGKVKTITIKANKTKTIKKQVDYTKNIGAYGFDVRFHVKGAAKERFTMGAKSPHNRNPGSGSYKHYIAKHTLQSVKCVPNETFIKIAKGMVKMKNAPEQIASLAKNGFNMGAKEVTKVLADVGVTASKTAQTIKKVYSPQIEQMATWLKYAGWGQNEVNKALIKIGVGGKQFAALYGKLWKARADVAYKFLSSTFKKSESQTIAWMKFGGYSLNQSAKAIKIVRKASVKLARSTLISVYKVSEEIVDKALISAGYTAAELGKIAADTRKEGQKTLPTVNKQKIRKQLSVNR